MKKITLLFVLVFSSFAAQAEGITVSEKPQRYQFTKEIQFPGMGSPIAPGVLLDTETGNMWLLTVQDKRVVLIKITTINKVAEGQ
jgi:hypothetical protein